MIGTMFEVAVAMVTAPFGALLIAMFIGSMIWAARTEED